MTTEKNVLTGGPDVPNFALGSQSLGEAALKKLREYNDDVLFVDGQNGATQTARQLMERSIQLAEYFRVALVRPGDVIGICSENRFEFPVVVFASIFVGATVAPLNVTYTTREVDHAINLSKPKFIFSSAIGIKKVTQVASRNFFVKKIINFDAADSGLTEESYQKIMSQKWTKSTLPFECVPIDLKKNISVILCSSGTTGLPKGVQLTQFNVTIANSQLLHNTSVIKAVLGQPSILSIVPWFHAYGLMTLIGMCVSGAKIVTLTRFDEKLFLSSIQNNKVNTLIAVPPLLVFLAKSPLVSQFDLSSLMVIFCGAAPLSKETEDAVLARLPSVLAIRQGFGMSELTLGPLTQNENFCTPGSVGGLSPGAFGKIVDPETGRALGPNERGEMCFKGSSVMHGYIGNTEATQSTIDPDGWLHTGDIGYYDEKGEWFIVDRIKELIKYKGFQVPPAEIESELLTHPLIMDAGVIGVPDEAVGELPLGFVVKQPGSNLTEKDVIDFIAGKVSAPKRLHGGVRFVTVIPKNPSGKILRRELRDLLKVEATKSKL